MNWLRRVQCLFRLHDWTRTTISNMPRIPHRHPYSEYGYWHHCTRCLSFKELAS